MAYRLRLPEASKIHNVFHVSLLRAFVKDDPQVPLPSKFVGNRPIAYPVAILDSQVLWHNGAAVEHMLVRWSDGSESPSWELFADLRKRFPTLSLEDKEISKEGGVVRDGPAKPTNDTNITDTTETPASTEEEEERSAATDEEEMPEAEVPEEETTTRKLRPRENIKPPNFYKNYVAK